LSLLNIAGNVTKAKFRDQSRINTESVELLISQHSHSIERSLESISQEQRRQYETASVLLLNEMEITRSNIESSAERIVDIQETIGLVHNTLRPTAASLENLVASLPEMFATLQRLVYNFTLHKIRSTNNLDRKQRRTTERLAIFPLTISIKSSPNSAVCLNGQPKSDASWPSEPPESRLADATAHQPPLFIFEGHCICPSQLKRNIIPTVGSLQFKTLSVISTSVFLLACSR
jgi:hypothetical protein